MSFIFRTIAIYKFIAPLTHPPEQPISVEKDNNQTQMALGFYGWDCFQTKVYISIQKAVSIRIHYVITRIGYNIDE